MKVTLVLPLFVAATLAACASNPGIVPIGDDAYSLTESTTGGLLGSKEKLKTRVIARADAFAASKGRVAVPLKSTEDPGKPGTMPSFEYQFRLADRAAAPAPAPVAPAPAVPAAAAPAHVHPAPALAVGPTGDYYTELVRLDDLRKKKIITEAEFEALKQKVIGSAMGSGGR